MLGRTLIKYIVVAILMMQQAWWFNIRADNLGQLRTSKKVVPVSFVTAPYFAIQILALKSSPKNPAFFSNVELAFEYVCTDGFVRYMVGPYDSFEAAKADVSRIHSLGYKEAFVVDVRKYKLKEDPGNSYRFDETGDTPPDPVGIYTVQLGAFRYPVYLSYFAEFDNVMEFYLKDKIYRYCVGKVSGNDALAELARVRAMGYPQAYLVLLKNYLPFQIE